MDRVALIREAREWIGTPFHHGQSVKGVGTDCLGFIRGVMLNSGALSPDWLTQPAVKAYAGYGPMPDGRLRQALDQFLSPIPAAHVGIGDLVLIRYTRDPQHVAVIAARPGGGLNIIHALPHGVVEHRFDDRWRSRVVAAYSLDMSAEGNTACCTECRATGGSCSA